MVDAPNKNNVDDHDMTDETVEDCGSSAEEEVKTRSL